MDPGAQKTESYFRELRLFLEEICCNLLGGPIWGR